MIHEGREFFVDCRGLFCVQFYLIIQRQISGEDGKKINELHTDKEWFVYDLYNLRSKIVHGNKLGETDKKNHKGEPWFELVILFFTECVRKTLSALSYYDYNDNGQNFLGKDCRENNF
ncbi:hypothetical protein AUJ66_00700 [Candidatus Desantisbacteria bacterium CG1_02_38_46]|uniref:Uncharacterized protein n=1 Tax=Candidatus Desantisbacteria bacterium CG1_02_38_46 TaxID=1817893 RepID=A0A1J4SGL1_9BACT|nr:MAG: hypothetical protein AUJ66_00700 [Candidatus Desantisbacteria bacterium CG1_02_38_46]